MVIIGNAFSLGMIEKNCLLRVEFIGLEEARKAVAAGNFESAVGHQSTANIYSQLLKVKVQADRRAIKLGPGDVLIVGQLLTRLPEGKVLSEEELRNFPIKWVKVEVLRE